MMNPPPDPKPCIVCGVLTRGRFGSVACERAGITPTTCTIETDDPVAYVLSLNLHRRHLTASQRALIGARARELYEAAAQERKRQGGERGRESQKGLRTNRPQANLGTGKWRDHAGKALDAHTPRLCRRSPPATRRNRAGWYPRYTPKRQRASNRVAQRGAKDAKT